MSNNISGLDLKREIIKQKIRGEERKALIAGFVRSCMSLSITRSGLMLQLDCQSEFVREYIADEIYALYKVCAIEGQSSILYDDCENLLRMLSVIKPNSFEPVEIQSFTDLSESAYVRGLFLGCGSFSARSSDGTDGQKGGGGYHLEFSVLSESLADELAALLNLHEIAVHKMERSEKYVVYVKDIDSVCNCLALMKLGKIVVKLNDTAISLSIKRDVNRRMNCEMANMTRTANASVDVINAIEYISEKIGLESLNPKLLEAAEARINSPESSLVSIAYELGISKSGLKHRFDKLIATAEELREKEERS